MFLPQSCGLDVPGGKIETPEPDATSVRERLAAVNRRLACRYAAEAVEDQYRMPEQRVIWYVMRDCEGIPFRAAEAFGDKVLLPSSAARVDHIDHFTSNRTHDELVLRSTFAEHHLFSMTDFQVIMDSSSYLKTGGAASLRSRSIFVVKTLFKVDGKPDGCFRSNYDSFEYLAKAWVKV